MSSSQGDLSNSGSLYRDKVSAEIRKFLILKLLSLSLPGVLNIINVQISNKVGMPVVHRSSAPAGLRNGLG